MLATSSCACRNCETPSTCLLVVRSSLLGAELRLMAVQAWASRAATGEHQACASNGTSQTLVVSRLVKCGGRCCSGDTRALGVAKARREFRAARRVAGCPAARVALGALQAFANVMLSSSCCSLATPLAIVPQPRPSQISAQTIHVNARTRCMVGAMGWLNNTTFIFQGLRHFTASGYERCSKGFDDRCAQAIEARGST